MTKINKTEEEKAKAAARQAAVKIQKILAKKIFASISKQKTIYDAQTVVNALSGYIKYELQVREAGFKVSDLIIDMTNEPTSKVKTNIESLLKELQGENAKDTAIFLEKFGGVLSNYSTAQYMKNPMSKIKMEDIIA